MGNENLSRKKYVKAVMNLALGVGALLCVLYFLPILINLFAPFIVGAIIAMIASPMVRFLERKLNIKQKAGSLVVMIGVIALVILVAYFIIALLVKQLVGFAEEVPAIWEAVNDEILTLSGRVGKLFAKLPIENNFSMQDALDQIGESVSGFLTAASSPTITALGNVAKQIPNAIVAVVFTVLSAFFFVSEKNTLREWYQDHAPAALREAFEIIRRSLVRGVGGYFKAQLKIEVWVYLLLVIGFLILKVSYAPLIALLIAFLDFLPVFGAGTAMIPWALIKLFDGDYFLFVGLLITWAVGQVVRQIIQPKIVADSVDMKPLPTIVLLYLGYRFAGVVGMIVAVPIGLILMTMYEEHAFDTFKDSIRILVAGFNNARRLTPEDMWEAEEVHSKSVLKSQQLAAESRAELERQRAEEEAYREERLRRVRGKFKRKK